MAIQQSVLLGYAARTTRAVLREQAKFAKLQNRQTAFLCHSHKDAELAKGVQGLLQEQGWDLYIDWDDQEMPESPNGETALRIKTKIIELDWFLFLATANSMGSRWCPWEIGFADGVKKYDSILVVPTSSGFTTHGSEYLRLYRRIDLAPNGNAAVFKPDGSGVYVRGLARP